MQCTNIGQYSNNIEYVGSNPTNGHRYLCIDGTLNSFNGSSLNSLGIPCGSYPWHFYSDESGLYAKDPNGNIRKLNHGGNSWTTIYNGGDVDYIIGSTNNYILAEHTAGGLIAIKKDNGSTVTLFNSRWSGILIPVGNTLFFYDFYTTQSCKWTEGSSQPTCKDKAYIAGVVLSPNGKWPISVHRILEVRNVDTTSNPYYPVGGTLYAVNPSDNSSIKLGDVPKDVKLWTFFGIGKYNLFAGEGGGNDIFFADVTKQGSFTQVTKTPDKFEWPVF